MSESDKKKPAESVIEVDVRGLVCPEPVVRTRKALETAGDRPVLVTTDSPESRDNIARFAERSGCTVSWTEREPGVYVVEVRRPGTDEPKPQIAQMTQTVPPSPFPSPFKGEGIEGRGCPGSKNESAKSATSAVEGSGPVLLLSSEELGRGDEKLGRLLMALFLRTLTEIPARPACLLLMNSGVKLALEDSEHLASLRTLESQGVTIRVCGTCLDFFGVRDRVRAGTVSNMYELAEMLMAGERLAVL